MEIAQMSIKTDDWINEVVHPYKGIVSSHQKGGDTDTGYNLKSQHKWKKSDINGHMFYDVFSMKSPEWTNLYRQKADWWLPGDVGGE